MNKNLGRLRTRFTQMQRQDPVESRRGKLVHGSLLVTGVQVNQRSNRSLALIKTFYPCFTAGWMLDIWRSELFAISLVLAVAEEHLLCLPISIFLH